MGSVVGPLWILEDGYSMQFDGTDERIDISPTINLGTTSSESIWIKQDTPTAGEAVIGQPVAAVTHPGNSYHLYLHTGGQCYVRVGDYFWLFDSVATKAAINTTDWIHIAIIRTGVTTCILYVNGVDNDGVQTNASLFGDTQISNLGCQDNDLYDFQGLINEYAGWANTALTAAQVSAIYSNGRPIKLHTPPFNPTVWYRMGDNGVFKDPQWLLPENSNKDKASNYSMSFDGVNQYVDLGDSDTFSFGDGVTDSPFSISSWVNMVDATDFVPIAKDNSGAREYVVRLVSDKIHFYVIDNSTGGYIGRLYNTALTSEEGNWIHIAVTYDGSSTVGGIKIYLNGSRVDDTNYTSGSYTAMENTSTALRIGSQQYGPSNSDGNIDEVSIFSSVLSASQVLGYYNSGTPTDLSAESNLVGYWKLGENATYKYPQWLIPNNENKDKVSNYSLEFDGINQYIDAPLDGTSLTDLSVSLWFKPGTLPPTSTGILRNLFSWTNFNGTNYYQFLSLIFRKVSWTTDYTIQLTPGIVYSTVFDPTIWNHLAVVRDSSTNIWTMYINGISVVTYDDGGTPPYQNNATNIYIGKNYPSGFDGNIDDVSVWDEALTQAQVNTIYNSGEPTDLSAESNLVGYWKLGEMAYSGGTGDIWAIPDSSPNSNTALAQSMTIDTRVGDAPNSTDNGLSSNMTIESRLGDAPNSSGNTISYNMDLNNRTTDVPT